MRHEFMHIYISLKLERLHMKLNWGIQIDKEDFMHDINQRKFKMDG